MKRIKKALIALGLVATPATMPVNAALPKARTLHKNQSEVMLPSDTIAEEKTVPDSVFSDAQRILLHQSNNRLLLDALAEHVDSAQIQILANKNDSLSAENMDENDKKRLDVSLTNKINLLIKQHTMETDSVVLDSAWNRLCSLEVKMLQFIAHFEDLRVRPYRVHPKDPLTYGYGFTYTEKGRLVQAGDRIRSVSHLYKVWGRCVRSGYTERPKKSSELNQCLFGELCQVLPISRMTDEQIIANMSFRYNGRPTFLKEKDGKSNFATLMYRYAITQDKEDLDTLLNLHARFCHSAGKVFEGLQKRRAVEASGIAGDIHLVMSKEEKDSLPEELQSKVLILRELTVGASYNLDMETIKNAEEYINKVSEVKGDTMEIQLQKKLYVASRNPISKAKAEGHHHQPATVRVRRGTRGK